MGDRLDAIACSECRDRGVIMVESGVIGPEGQRELLPEPCGCEAGHREWLAWQAEAAHQRSKGAR